MEREREIEREREREREREGEGEGKEGLRLSYIYCKDRNGAVSSAIVSAILNSIRTPAAPADVKGERIAARARLRGDPLKPLPLSVEAIRRLISGRDARYAGDRENYFQRAIDRRYRPFASLPRPSRDIRKGEPSGSNKLRSTGYRARDVRGRRGFSAFPFNGRALRLLLQLRSRYLGIARDVPIGASSFLMNSNYRLCSADIARSIKFNRACGFINKRPPRNGGEQ